MGSYLGALDHPGKPGSPAQRSPGHGGTAWSALRLVTAEDTSRIDQSGFYGI